MKERHALGQARRKQMGRQQHDELKPKARPATAADLLDHAMKGRLPRLVQLKNKLMATSPFAYFRGAAPVMAADLAMLPTTGLVAQLCGDAHVRNLGAFAAPDGKLVFDINDFDESIRGPFEWDLKRMAASLILAGRASGHKDSSARSAAEACMARYAAQMKCLTELSVLEAARFQVHRLADTAPVHAALKKAESSTAQHTLEQLTELASEPADEQTGKGAKKKSKPAYDAHASRRFRRIENKLEPLTSAQAAQVLVAYESYKATVALERRHLLSFYRPIDVAFKVVGTGSVGLRDYCIYLEGNGEHDPLFIQIKEEAASAWAPWLADAHPPAHNGQRAVEGQLAMQMQSDPFLGWTQIAGHDYLVRQLSDHKGSIELTDLAGDALTAYAEVCGELLARGHARSGDPVVLSGYLGAGDGFAEAVAKFGQLYADQNEKDWSDLKRSLAKKEQKK